MLVRSALVVVLGAAAALAVVGALALRIPGLVALMVAAALVGATTAGMVSEAPGARRGAALDAGVRAAGWTAGALLVLAGLSALAGALVAVLVGAVVAGAVVGVRLRRSGAQQGRTQRPAPVRPLPVRTDGPTLLMPPVGGLSTRALGDEWLRSTVLLTARLDPVVRRALVGRREMVLDELERRDPDGFARWLADGPAPGSDPAAHVRDLPAAGTEAA
ncbi:hypothetical protein SAMN05660748_0793 [Blastococcus aggregatus]|uniref:Uncharacterized protein n=1 Tax=Blastococcus aggregatus TaxID=38502 RepID=A0A285UZT3_9ACTN|nr:hypothetical protein [Blastococcus aggregatus]SOC47394.1 hypothetical protein SAMN05660748_0793 [Blastococcus aggregatus]